MNEDTLKRCTSFPSVCHLCEGHMERYKNDDVDSIMPLQEGEAGEGQSKTYEDEEEKCCRERKKSDEVRGE